MKQRLVVAVTGASGSLSAKRIVEKSQFPIILAASDWGKRVYETECGPFTALAEKAAEVYDNDDMFAPIASGSTQTAGMIVAPCSVSTLARIANGLGDDLIARAAHCHLKERQNLILCLRESPLTSIDLHNAAAVSSAGAQIMPISFPFYMMKGRDPNTVTLMELMDVFAERVLALIGQPPTISWENLR
jgi:4-hydroxy-3-polyprenylbenzoate decarboxylase